jgi:hypothetical protein
VAVEVVQQQALRNRNNLNMRDPAKREAAFAEMRATVEDPEKHRAFLLRPSKQIANRTANRAPLLRPSLLPPPAPRCCCGWSPPQARRSCCRQGR